MTFWQENKNSRLAGFWSAIITTMIKFSRVRDTNPPTDDILQSASQKEIGSAKPSLQISQDVVTKLSIRAGCSAGLW